MRATRDGERLLNEKITLIRGDITQQAFGICGQDLELLNNEVSVVINSAATVRFSEPIQVAMQYNVCSVQHLIEFCDKLQQLRAVIHLSTAFSNCHKRDPVYEVFYEPPMRGRELMDSVSRLADIQAKIREYPTAPASGDTRCRSGAPAARPGALESIERNACLAQTFHPPGDTDDDDLLAKFTQIAIRKSNRPNTYTLTKAIAESHLFDLVHERGERYLGPGGIPVCIIRPSIVGSAWREPEGGFVDSLNGPTSAMMALYTGALQAMPGDGALVADIVPVDMVVNICLAVGHFLAQKQHLEATKPNSSSDIKPDRGLYIFNFTSSARENRCLWRYFTEGIRKMAYQYPSERLVRLASSFFISSPRVYNVYYYLNHTMLGQLVDAIKKFALRQELSRRTSSVVLCEKLRMMADMLTPFTSNQWTIDDTNVKALYASMSPSDRRLFEFDVGKVDWRRYVLSYVIGGRIWALNDRPESLARARTKLNK